MLSELDLNSEMKMNVNNTTKLKLSELDMPNMANELGNFNDVKVVEEKKHNAAAENSNLKVDWVKNTKVIRQNSTIRGDDSFPLGRQHLDVKKVVKLYDLVILEDRRIGRVMYIGPVKLERGEFVGLHLLNCTGKNNGTYKRRTYFDAPENSSIFVKSSAVEDILPSNLDTSLIEETKEDFEYYYSLFKTCYTQSDNIKTYPKLICSLIIHNLAYYLPEANYDIIDYIFGFVGDFETYRKQKFELKIPTVVNERMHGRYRGQDTDLQFFFKLNKYGERRGELFVRTQSRIKCSSRKSKNKYYISGETTHQFRALTYKELKEDRMLKARRTDYHKLLKNDPKSYADDDFVGYKISNFGRWVTNCATLLEKTLTHKKCFENGFVSDKVYDYEQ